VNCWTFAGPCKHPINGDVFSWGRSWGVDGYMYIARNVNMCGIALCATYPAVWLVFHTRIRYWLSTNSRRFTRQTAAQALPKTTWNYTQLSTGLIWQSNNNYVFVQLRCRPRIASLQLSHHQWHCVLCSEPNRHKHLLIFTNLFAK